MNQAKITVAALLTGLLAGAGFGAHAQTTEPAAPADTTVITTTTEMGAPGYVQAQPHGRGVPRSTASVTSNVPVTAGEASTMTNGVPNMSTYNANTDDGGAGYRRRADVARVPEQAGEASTMGNGRPNWNPDDPAMSQQRDRSMGYGTPQQ